MRRVPHAPAQGILQVVLVVVGAAEVAPRVGHRRVHLHGALFVASTKPIKSSQVPSGQVKLHQVKCVNFSVGRVMKVKVIACAVVCHRFDLESRDRM